MMIYFNDARERIWPDMNWVPGNNNREANLEGKPAKNTLGRDNQAVPWPPPLL